MKEDNKPDLDLILVESDKELTFAKRLKKLRMHLNKTQTQFSSDTGISNITLSKLESDTTKIEPRMETIKKIVATYGVSADWLLGFADSLNMGDYNKRDIIDSVFKMVDLLGEYVSIDTSVDAEDGKPLLTKIHIADDGISQFFHEWLSINKLYIEGTIKKEHYELILNDLLAKVV